MRLLEIKWVVKSFKKFNFFSLSKWWDSKLEPEHVDKLEPEPGQNDAAPHHCPNPSAIYPLIDLINFANQVFVKSYFSIFH